MLDKSKLETNGTGSKYFSPEMDGNIWSENLFTVKLPSKEA